MQGGCADKKDSVFAKLDELKKAGKISDYGVSIEKVSEGMAAMDYDRKREPGGLPWLQDLVKMAWITNSKNSCYR